MNPDQIKYMVDRFLGWKLPENFNPDGGISFKKAINQDRPTWPQKNEPTGTNVFDADQAEEMVRYMVEGCPAQDDEKIEKLELELGCERGTLSMAVARLGGIVEGNPTGRHNFLQRIDELTRMERWLGQAANLLNLYAHGFCPKDVALDLLTKIKSNWPDMLDDINPLASPVAGGSARIAEIASRLAAITKGEWKAYLGTRKPVVATSRGSIATVCGGRGPSSYTDAMTRQEAEANTEFIAAAPDDIAFLLKLQPEGWVKVTPETMPEVGPMLTCDENGVEQGYLYNGNWFLSRTDGQNNAIEIFPTHWRPLPAPPAAVEVRP